MPRVDHVLSSAAALFGVRPGEGRRTALLFAYLLLASAVFVLGRTVRDTLFLSRYPVSALPWMFVLYGVASALTVVAYARWADRITRSKLVVVSVGVASATYLATWVLVGTDVEWVYPVFYVWSEVVANLLIVQFWTIANDLHDPRAARRLFPAIASARIVGVVVIGLLSGGLVRAIGTPALLFVLVGMMIAMAGMALALRREPRADTEPARRGPRARIMRDPYVLALAGFTLLAFTALTIGDYQFKIIARAAYREDELARFFSLLYAAIGVLAVLIQLFVTPWLLRRFGVGFGMAAMPGLFGIASAVLPLAPHLPVVAVMKFADNGLQYTVHDTTVQALYAPFRPEVKARTRAFLDALVKPLSYGVGGLLLVLLAPRMPAEWLSIVTVVLVIGWLVVIPVVRRRYAGALEGVLGTAGTLADDRERVVDASATESMIGVLSQGRPEQVLAVLEQLENETSEPFVRAVERLTHAVSPEIRAAAYERLATLTASDPQISLRGLADEDPTVRGTAAWTIAQRLGDDALEPLMGLVRDSSQDVRVAAVAGMLVYTGIEGAIEGGRELSRLLASEDDEDRIEACRVLRRLGPAAFRPVRTLLADSSADVRRAALRAAGAVADPRLVPALIEALQIRSTRGRAIQALVAVGQPAGDALAQLLQDPNTPREIRLVLPRILRAIPSRRTYALLWPLARAYDGHLRLRVLAALASIRAAIGLRESRAHVRELVRFEVRAAYRNLAAWRRARPIVRNVLLDEEFAFRQTRAVRRILRILELRYDRTSLKLVRGALDRGLRRAQALEMLDALIEPALRAMVVPFLDDGPAKEKLARAGDLLPEVPEPLEFMTEQCEHPNPFVAALALDALPSIADAPADRVASIALGHRDPLVREQALRTLFRVAPDTATIRAQELAQDPDQVVARLATLVAASRGSPKELHMPSTLEKVLVLKSAPLFSRVPAEDLASLARMAESRIYSPGQTIVTEGELGDELYLVVYGRVTVARGGQRMTTLGPGESFGEISVLDEGPRTATVTAEEQSEVLAIASEDFYEILREQAEIAEGVIRILVKRLREADAPI
ncbi:MAG TPA: Npt1/Npt2 family nucleotide transporter [Nannocystaceae bacterium]|nr:Npt1/Npt2 family nucleotide transporter [Nannocystaceae bacterium]